MPFEDRTDAGRRLADRIPPGAEVVVLAIPRGGVPVAREVARRLGAPLDIVALRKLGAPGNPELGIGAIAGDGTRVLDERLVRMLGVSESYVDAEAARQLEEVRRRASAYRGDRPPPEVAGKTCVVVDDGIATGGSMRTAIRWLRARGAGRVVAAVPVAPADAVERLAAEADEVVVLEAPESFRAVSEWYRDFPQVSDAEVVAALAGGP